MFRLVTFNILEGASTPPKRFERIAELLEGLRPDLVFLQECVDWKSERLQELGELVSLNHHYLTQCNPRGSGRRYNLGALSREPIEKAISHTPNLLAHGCQEIRLEHVPLTFFNIHLVARTEEERVSEIRWFLQSPREGVLAGDLNCLSPDDPYTPELAMRLLEAGVKKYGNPPRFDTMELLRENGWHAIRPGNNGRDGTEWVTRWRTEVTPPLPTRTDYVLTSSAVLPCLSSVWHVDLKHEESDHNPVVADFEW